jgi:5-hydroxyisourate hydrolase
MSLSSHVLDGARGVPAAGVRIRWDRLLGDDWEQVAEALTDSDGRVTRWAGGDDAGSGTGTDTDTDTPQGVHRLVFGSGDYFAAQGTRTFYPEVVVQFEVIDADDHHHVPLLLSPFAYSTYRGS